VIIGVDESGDFRLGSRALFVGIFIRPSQRSEVVQAHRRWEKEVRKSLGLRNEVKGHAVTDYWARRLFYSVLRPDDRQRVRYLAFAVDISQANLDAMEVQRQILLDGYAAWAADVSDPDNRKRAAWVERHAAWTRAQSARQLLRIVTLGTLITTLIEWAMPQAILGGFDEELEHLQVLIDRGYVKQDDLSRWRELLRNAVINESRLHPLAILDTWTDDHPFLRKFIAAGGNGPTLLKPAFREAIDFHDSEATPEVRVADVVASLIYQAMVGGANISSYQLIRTLSLEPASPYRLIMWTKNRRPTIENPYLAFKRSRD
jgi:hypothetical protein